MSKVWTTMRVLLSDRQLLSKVKKRVECDPAFRRRLEQEFSENSDGENVRGMRPSGTTEMDNAADHGDQMRAARQAIIQMLPSILDLDQPTTFDRLRCTRQLQLSKKRCEARELAEKLVDVEFPGPNDTTIVLTRADIEHYLIKKLRITRNAAQSAATKAINTRDPGNPARRTRKLGIGRRVTPELIKRIHSLEGRIPMKDIAKVLGCDQKTVYKHRLNRGRYRLCPDWEKVRVLLDVLSDPKLTPLSDAA